MAERILVVDDEPDAAALVAELLRAEGYEAVTATTARDAVRRATEDEVDLVVLDIMMAHPSEGLDVARTLRERRTTRRLPVVLLSGADAAWGLRDAIGEQDLPCDAYLDKPVDRRRLVDAVRRALAAPRPTELAVVVEDEADFAAYLGDVLGSAGYRVLTAPDAAAAEALLAQHRPDLVTLDLDLPVGSGAGLYRRLRRDPRLAGVPVVVITGLPLDHPEVGGLGRDLSADRHLPLPDAYLEKPVAPEALRRVLDDLATSPRERPPASE